MVSLGTKLCHLGVRLAWVKSNFFSHPVQYIQTCTLWLQLCTGTFRLETWTSIKALSFVSDCLRHCSQGLQDYSWEGLVPVHEPLQHLQLGLGSVFLLPDAELGETPSRSFAGSHSSCKAGSHRHFCLWMDAKLLLRGWYGWGISYLVMLWRHSLAI